MEVTNKIILDLLPLYYAGEASEDTKKFIEEYLNTHQDFAREVKELSLGQLPPDIPMPLEPENEMLLLRKTKKWLQLRSVVFMIAIFFSFLPFTFGNFSRPGTEGMHWLWTGSPHLAILSGLIGLAGWIGYIIIKKRLNVTAL